MTGASRPSPAARDAASGAVSHALLAFLIFSPVACAEPSMPSSSVQVAFRVDRTISDRAAGHIAPGETVGVVRLLPDAAATLVSAPAGDALAMFRRALETGERPAVSPTVDLDLPEPPPDLRDVELDVALFADRDGDGEWDEGESYVSAWSGGRGSYRLVYVTEPREDMIGAVAGWNLVEGGQPQRYTGDLAHTIVYLRPVIEPVEGR